MQPVCRSTSGIGRLLRKLRVSKFGSMPKRAGSFLLQRELELTLQARHPERFIPHYAMVTFMRIPYSVALARSDIQREILVAATQGKQRLDEVDMAQTDAMVLAQLQPLSDLA